KTGQHRAAAADADRAAEREPANGMTLYFAARAYAQAVKAAADDKAESDPPGQAKRYGERCVELLRRGLATGGKEAERLAPGGDFDPVRDRPDFQQLLAEAGKRP